MRVLSIIHTRSDSRTMLRNHRRFVSGTKVAVLHASRVLLPT